MDVIPFDSYPKLENHQDPEFNYLITEVFEPIDYISLSQSNKFDTKTGKVFAKFNDFIKDYRVHIGPDLYPCARLILPEQGTGVLYVRDATIINIVKHLYNIPKKGVHANKLNHWKRNKSTKYRQNQISLPQLIAQTVKDYRETDFSLEGKSPVTVGEINKFLDELPLRTKVDKQVELFRPIFERLDIRGIRWLITIILKESTIHGYKKVFLNCYHPQALSLYGSCKKLETVIKFLHDPNKFYPQQQFNPQYGHPFNPMTSQKLKNYQEIVKSMPSGFFIEEKVDGDRMILHYKDGKFRWWSRRIRDYTNLYGDSFSHGSLTGNLKPSDQKLFFEGESKPDQNAFDGPFHKKTKSIILDGEMVAFDPERNIILPFGTLRDAAVQEGVRQFSTTDMYKNVNAHPFYLVFDVLEFNGTSFIYDKKKSNGDDKELKGYGQTLEWRKNFLKSVINPISTRLELLPYTRGNTVVDIENAMRKIISQRCEGIMVKSVKGVYKIDTRSFNSIKIKPEYLEEFGDNLDLPVIGIIKGKEKHSYMFGLYDENKKVWRSFCTVANGFRRTEYNTIENLLRSKYVKKCPEGVVFGSKKPDLYIHPDDSIVIEVKARSLESTIDGKHHTNTTLHNSWARTIRDDKSATDCQTFQDFLRLRQDHSTDISKDQESNKKRRKLSSLKETKVTAKSDLFKDFSFVVLSDYLEAERIDITKVKNIIITYGGKIIHDPKKGGKVLILSNLLTPVVNRYLEMGFDIVKPRWVFESIKNMTILQLDEKLIFKTKNEKLTHETLDEFGDSYSVMPESVIEFLNSIEPTSSTKGQSDLTVPLLKDLFQGISFEIIGSPMEKNLMTKKIEQFHGSVNGNPSFIVVISDNGDVDRISKDLSENFKEGDKIPRIVSDSFVDDCIKNECLVDARDHLYHRKS
ncbi:DNA ligase 4 [[Candida] jaroonii]|uniref:DNA ligase 4 n=1 Tax=[Candida] jaroonii TaxID=467808 RepID=A0ACA9YAT8_9ASCO|nr:DNA ligase 4 [[Candida] jaroonii]